MRILVAIFVVLSAAFRADAAGTDLAGTWVLTAQGKIVSVIRVGTNAGNDLPIVENWKPTTMGISMLREAINIAGPVEGRILSIERREDAALWLRVPLGRSGKTDRVRVSLVNPDVLSWTWVDSKVDPLLFRRTNGNPTVAQDFAPEVRYPLDEDWPDNPRMRTLFEADQAARAGGPNLDWSAIAKQDDARRADTRKLLETGALRSGADFYRAAFVFQHGNAPDDFLLAHALAIASLGRGYRSAAWIAAATIDRYLQKVGGRQIYGTQYLRRADGSYTQDPFDRALIPDGLRSSTGVESLADQETQRLALSKRLAEPASK